MLKKERNPKNQLMTSSFTELPKIIRNDIAKVKLSTEHDPTPADASRSHSFHSMPNSLLKLLNWLSMHNYIWCPYYLPSFMKFCSVVSEELR
jgi:hypothetical protein